jgi:hypothetical protein
VDYSKWKRIPRIPKVVRLPGGFCIPVKLAPRPSEYLDEDDDGIYDSVAGIVLWENLTPRQKWHRLAHEMKHAYADWDRWIEIGTNRS